MTYISPLLTAFVNAVKKSATNLNRDFNELEKLQNSIRGNRNFVVNSYGKVENTMRIELAKIRPDLPIFTPSSTVTGNSFFAISPIEGLLNFSHGNPDFAVSAALIENNILTCGIVYNPSRDEAYFGEKGKGSFKEGYRNHERLRVSSTKDLQGALIASTSSFKEDGESVVKLHSAIAVKTGNLRISGCIAQDLAYLAGGKLDAVLSLDNHICNIAGGMLLVKEAGGSVRGLNQKDIRAEDLSEIFKSGNLAASNFNLNQKVFEILK